MNNITFVIFTYNEEHRIDLVMRNVKNYGEVLVLDGGSTDSTRDIVEKHGGRFVTRPPHDKAYIETQEMYNFILPHVNTDWIFWDFADNFLPESLLDILVEISQQKKIKYVNVPIFTYLWGVVGRAAQKGYSPRFFHKDYVSFENNKIHGMGSFVGKEDEKIMLSLKQEYAIEHYSLYDLEKFVNSHLSYGVAEAKSRFDSGEKFNVWRMVGSMVRSFFVYFKSGYKNGSVGFFVALLYAFFRLMTHIKLYELEHSVTIDNLESKYKKEKEQIINQIEKK